MELSYLQLYFCILQILSFLISEEFIPVLWRWVSQLSLQSIRANLISEFIHCRNAALFSTTRRNATKLFPNQLRDS